jgi:hypothetical protein
MSESSEKIQRPTVRSKSGILPLLFPFLFRAGPVLRTFGAVPAAAISVFESITRGKYGKN